VALPVAAGFRLGVTDAEVQVIDDRDGAPGRDDRPPGYLLPRRLRLPEVSRDPARLARQILGAVVPGFAEAAGVFVLEELLSGGNPADQAPGADVIVRELGAGVAVDGRLVPGALFPPGEAIACAADSPFTRCLRDRSPVVFDQPDGTTLGRMTPEGKAAVADAASFLAAPMITRGTVTGFLVLARTGNALAFRRPDATAVADLAARAGTAIASSLALMRQGSVAEALRPRRPAVVSAAPARLEIAGRPPVTRPAVTGMTSFRCPGNGPGLSSATSWATARSPRP
jgi:GAF domain